MFLTLRVTRAEKLAVLSDVADVEGDAAPVVDAENVTGAVSEAL